MTKSALDILLCDERRRLALSRSIVEELPMSELSELRRDIDAHWTKG